MTISNERSLHPGITATFSFTVPETKTVPYLYQESGMFQQMPEVFATGFMVGLLEWACIESIKEQTQWPVVQSVGTLVNFSHLAPTPPGLVVTVSTELVEVDGRRLVFKASAHDGIDLIAEGFHERMMIDPARFAERARQKRPRSPASV